MRRIDSSKIRVVFWVMLGIACLTSSPAMAGGYYSDGIHIPEGVCMDCPPPENTNNNSSGYTGPSQSKIRERQERAERNERIDKANNLLNAAKAAASANDAREALRLAREAQAMANDYTWLQNWVRQLEDYIADQSARETADVARDKANAAYDRGDWREALVLYRRALTTHADSLSDYGKQRVKELDERLKRETEAADLERRHRPEVERLRAEATALLDANPAGALAKLDAALKLLPGDTKTTGDWWLAQASLALLEARYDAAFEALEKSKGYGLDAGEIARWQGRIRDERAHQGAEVQNAFADLRQRLAATPVGTEPGAQLKSIHQSSNVALSSSVAEKDLLTPGRADKKMAGDGFDTPGKDQGALVYPDKNRHRPQPSVLDKQVPAGAKEDPQIKKMQTWYRSLEVQKAEKEQKIAEIKEQQKTSQDPLLTTKIATLANDVKRLNDDQGLATKSVKKRVLDMGLAWDESPLPGPAATAESVKDQKPESAKLDFIQD